IILNQSLYLTCTLFILGPDFKYVWLAHQPHTETLAELVDQIDHGFEYFTKIEISSKRNNLTAEDFRNEATE
ncbi:hypothetical protein PS412_10130, partial [Limosilactobacillus fermentum]